MVKHLKKGDPAPAINKDKFTLYAMRFCPFCMKAALVMHHHEMDFDKVFIDLINKPSWFVELNPAGRVPFIHKGGEKMGDSDMICSFIDQLHPTRSLEQVSGPEDMKKMKEFSSKYFPAFHAILFDKENTQEQKDLFLGMVNGMEAMVKGPFVGGPEVGMTDYLIYPLFDRMEACYRMMNLDLPTETSHPRLVTWLKAMRSLPAVAKISIDPDTHYKFAMSAKAGATDADM